MFKISTLTQFVALIIFALTLSLWRLNSMLVLMAMFLLLLIYQKNYHFFRLIKRLRWVFIVMFLIFLLNTPGEHIVSWPYSVKPTYEGLHAGIKQVLSITLMLATLSLILAKNTTQQLISGLYFLLKPLSLIGVDIKRFAARLWLTLHYVELQQAEKTKTTLLTKGLVERLETVFSGDSVQHVEVKLEKNTLTWLDYAVILMMFVFLVIAIVTQGF